MLRPRFGDSFQTDNVSFKEDASFGIVPVRERKGAEEFLLVLSRKGHWSFPKGHADPGETPVEAAKRELQEETGLTKISLDLARTFVEHYEFVSKSGKPIRKSVTYYVGHVKKDEPVQLQASEIADYLWADEQAALERITFDECRELFRDVLVYLHSTPPR